ncbi:hypothetical protein E2P81_ATG04930 [Venturia nashicola]|nr:hypothetical protein E2P81_ATG04930 [Venturia nashicola]
MIVDGTNGTAKDQGQFWATDIAPYMPPEGEVEYKQTYQTKAETYVAARRYTMRIIEAIRAEPDVFAKYSMPFHELIADLDLCEEFMDDFDVNAKCRKFDEIAVPEPTEALVEGIMCFGGKRPNPSGV